MLSYSDNACRDAPMRKLVVLFVCTLIGACTIPAVASECVSTSSIHSSRAYWARVRSQAAGTVDEKACLAYAALFYETVVVRSAAAICVHGASREQTLALLDSEISAFNDLLAVRCGHRT